MRYIAVVSLAVLCAACPSAEAPCGPTKCSGCCDPVSGACVGGFTSGGCGLGGRACVSCTANQVCMGGACIAQEAPPTDAGVPATCTDGIWSEAETDVDCGGACPACGAGKACAAPSDCISRQCHQGVCQPPLACADGKKNGSEGDVDCGGALCFGCGIGKSCIAHADCLSGACIFGVCKEPSCSDGAKNQQEGDIDCGGPCPACDDGKTCREAADCASGQCASGVCVSCADGLKNGSESDVDCGGSCGKCASGRTCSLGSDCAGGGCEGGVCCQKNACGQCAALPAEVCDGKDNDCSGTVDEPAKIGAGATCPKQSGVCAGARQACRGTSGWQCDDSSYRAHNPKYEANEVTCDGVDNDCDGAVDEGLKNACGACGAVPLELCDGLDNDCDGTVDDDPRCASCPATPTPVELDHTYNGYDLTHSGTNSVTQLGDTVYVLVKADDTYIEHLFRLENGAMVMDYQPAITMGGGATIASDGTNLHVGSPVYTGNGFEAVHYKLSPTGVVLATHTVANTEHWSAPPVVISAAGTRLAMAYWKDGAAGTTWARFENNTWTEVGNVHAGQHLSERFEIDRQGTPYSAWLGSRSPPYPLYFRAGSNTVQSLSSDSGSPALRVAPNGDVYIVYREGSDILLRKLGGATMGPPEKVATGNAPGLAFDTLGNPVVSFTKGSLTLSVAQRVGTSWKVHDVHTISTTWRILHTGVVVDGAGRYHLVYFTYEYSGDEDAVSYVMYCPK